MWEPWVWERRGQCASRPGVRQGPGNVACLLASDRDEDLDAQDCAKVYLEQLKILDRQAKLAASRFSDPNGKGAADLREDIKYHFADFVRNFLS